MNVFLFSTTSAVLAILLNIYFIKLYGIIGAAYATLIVMVLINLMKILLVQFTFKINPFGKKTILILFVIFTLHLIFSHIDLDFPPIISLVLRSLLIGLLFSLISYLLKLTEDFQVFLTNLISFKKKF